MYTRRSVVRGGVAAVGLALGGVGSATAHQGDSYEVGHPSASVTVAVGAGVVGQSFDPAVVHVEEGGTVTWEHADGTHDVTAYHPDTYGEQLRIPEGAEPWGSDLLSADGDTFQRTFEEPGVYDYVCTPHVDGGMVGTVVVGWPDVEGEPGLAPLDDTVPPGAASAFEEYNQIVRDVLPIGAHEDCTEVWPDQVVCDLDGDGTYRDVNGNGRQDFDDVVTYFENLDAEIADEDLGLVDYNSNDRVDSDDLVTLFESL